MIELFSRRKADYFKTSLGIHSLPGHFRNMENELEKIIFGNGEQDDRMETDTVEAEKVLLNDDLFPIGVKAVLKAWIELG